MYSNIHIAFHMAVLSSKFACVWGVANEATHLLQAVVSGQPPSPVVAWPLSCTLVIVLLLRRLRARFHASALLTIRRDALFWTLSAQERDSIANHLVEQTFEPGVVRAVVSALKRWHVGRSAQRLHHLFGPALTTKEMM